MLCTLTPQSRGVVPAPHDVDDSTDAAAKEAGWSSARREDLDIDFCDIDVVDAATINRAMFQRLYLHQRRPVILRHG